MREEYTELAGTNLEAPPRTPKWLPFAPWIFVALWSGGYVPVKVGLAYVEPLFFLVLRYGAVLALLLPICLFVRPPWPKRRRDWMHLAIVGTLIQGIYFAFANLAIMLGASAAGLAIVLALQPLLVALIAPRITSGELVNARVWLGLLLGLAGAVIVIISKADASDVTAVGIATACAGLLFITAGTLWEKRFGSAQHPIPASIIQCGVAGLLALAVAWPLETFRVEWTWAFCASLAYLVICNSIISMTLLLAMVRYGQATRASSLLFLVPPGSSLIATVLLGEPFPLLCLAGMALAGAGVWMVRATA